MKTRFPDVVEKGRVKGGHYATSGGERYGAFMLKAPTGGRLRILVSDGDESMRWEHVSVSLEDRCPTWEEMCWVKSLFWEPEECVVQYHPPESEYVNRHQFCLHLWRPLGAEVPRPPRIAVG